MTTPQGRSDGLCSWWKRVHRKRRLEAQRGPAPARHEEGMMSNERGGTTRRRLLEGAAGVAAAGLLSGTGPTLAEALAKHGRTPLWEVAQRRGIVYGGSISTWMYQGDPGDP